MEDFNKNEDKNEYFSIAVKAGKRTYFFDVKGTKRNDLYLTITESKKRFTESGEAIFEKHKIFLYREDFEKFEGALKDALKYIKTNCPIIENVELEPKNFSSKISFDDLDK